MFSSTLHLTVSDRLRGTRIVPVASALRGICHFELATIGLDCSRGLFEVVPRWLFFMETFSSSNEKTGAVTTAAASTAAAGVALDGCGILRADDLESWVYTSLWHGHSRQELHQFLRKASS